MMPGGLAKGLDRLFRPRSIAVIGGGVWCANVIEQCQKMGFAGKIWPVHPTKATVAGQRAYSQIADLPAAPDAAFIGINRDHTIGAAAELARIGAGGAVCFASGFQEAQAETGDGASLQAALLQAAGAMPILGPNCYGFVNYLDGAALWPDQHGGANVARGVALVTQSSNIAINLTMQDRGLPVAYVVTAGNQAQTPIPTIVQALLQDDRVTAIGLYLEGVGDLRAFEAMAAAARAKGKPIVAIKVGRSDQAQTATISHTASVAGSDAGARALLRRLGIAQVASLPALLETLKLLHVSGPLPSNRIASLSCSGGEASLMADSALGHDLTFPALDIGQETALRAALGPRVALANPLDYHTYIWGNVDAMAETFTAMMQGDLAMGCVVLDFPRADRCDAAAWEPVIEAVARTQTRTGRPLAILSTLKENLPEATAHRLMARGIVAFAGIDEAMTAMAAAAWLGRGQPDPLPLLLPRPNPTATCMTEAQSKATLARFGVAVPRAASAPSPAAAAVMAAQIGFPIALKGEGIAHKTEAGAVRLNLMSDQAVASAAQSMPASQFLVEEMIPDAVAELLVGVVLDPAHGYVLTLAAGGVLTEILQDRVSLLVPAGRDEVMAALRSLRLWPLITGYRGKPAADLGAILDAVMAVQTYVAAHHPTEVEINPLLCCPTRAVAADALITNGAPLDD